MFLNELFYWMRIVDSPECHLCKNTRETIKHGIFWCQKIYTFWRQIEIWLGMVLKDKIKISDSEKIFGGAYKNSIFYTVFFNKEKIFKSRHKGNFAEINYELSVQLHYEQSRTTPPPPPPPPPTYILNIRPYPLTLIPRRLTSCVMFYNWQFTVTHRWGSSLTLDIALTIVYWPL